MSAMASQITSLTIAYSRRRPKKTSKLPVTGLCEGNSPEFPAQRASTAENVSIWWRHHDITEYVAVDVAYSNENEKKLPWNRMGIL